MFYPQGYRKPKCSAGLLDFSVAIRYVLPTRLQRAEMQWLLDFGVNIGYVLPTKLQRAEMQWLIDLRWLDWIFWGWYLPSLSINYVGMSKDIEKRLPQLYYIKMKIC